MIRINGPAKIICMKGELKDILNKSFTINTDDFAIPLESMPSQLFESGWSESLALTQDTIKKGWTVVLNSVVYR